MKTDWDWAGYYDNTPLDKEYGTLTKALEFWGDKTPGTAVDLGCGHGMDTIRLLKQNWEVLAVDPSEEGIKRLKERDDLPKSGVLKTRCTSFQEFTFPNKVDLINASKSLPFCDPKDFEAVWKNIINSLGSGGIFCGHFFGDKDDWVKHGLTIVSKEQLEVLFKDFKIFYFKELSEPGVVATGEKKFWHVFDVCAYKK
jgi:SAM-dependent methyltransferase